MDEFLNITWKRRDVTSLEHNEFINEELISNSYIYSTLDGVQLPVIKVPKSLSERYVPGKKLYRPVRRKSLLKKNQKEICLKALQAVQSGCKITPKVEEYLRVYKQCYQHIVTENAQFQNFVQSKWPITYRKSSKCPDFIGRFGFAHWTGRCERIASQYAERYSSHSMLSVFVEPDEITANFQCVSTALEIGEVAHFTAPSLVRMCKLAQSTLPTAPSSLATGTIVHQNSLNAVSEDGNTHDIVMRNPNINVVISTSALNSIMYATENDSYWIMPLVVKLLNQKRVIFLDKCLPPAMANEQKLNQTTLKRLLKTNCCPFKAVSYENNPESNEEVGITGKGECRRLHTNANYRIWNITVNGHQEDNMCGMLLKQKLDNRQLFMLVRSRLDACERTNTGELQPVILRPKIEYQLCYGAEVPTKSDLARDWCALFFRPFSSLYRARIHLPQNKIVTLEKCCMQKINTEAATHYNFRPHLGLNVLAKVFCQLLDQDIPVGQHLLQHSSRNSNHLSLLLQNSDGSYNLHQEYTNCKLDDVMPKWTPIDVNYILPVHTETKTIPGLYEGFDKAETTGSFKRSNKKNKKKKKNKQKRQQQATESTANGSPASC